ncbi:MAG: amino acid ABC transporter ATP-binding protein [Erysipelotrichaceae bacterium]|nr:amino acid ABC transporter ATP-binding protein [Erysipelotrichaceae bacterium]MDY2731651.1 amino acid ABC transporter ATP-binding protein [Erysipelotrichaceae bacterium]
MISVKNLCKSYDGLQILKDVNIDFPDGSTTVIIGGSGCGKSTLLRCLNLLEKPDCGTIEIDGEDIVTAKNVDKLRQKLGMVYQSFNLFSHLSVLENIILAPMKVKKISKEEAISKAYELLKMVGMENRATHMPDQLSGGQKQRVAIARALAMEPEVMLFDEPTSALDPTMVDEVETVIKRLVDSGMTSIIVTHEMRFARNIASNILFLAEGGVYEEGSPDQIFDNPQKDLTRRFIYRSRMYEEALNKTDIDIYELCSRIRQYAIAYGLTRKQSKGIEYFCEELIYPLIMFNNAVLRIIADENRNEYSITAEFKGLNKDPLSLECIDELGLSIVKAYSSSLNSSCINGIWQINATI